MYIWLGIDVDDQLGAIKTAAQRAEEQVGFSHSNFTLPMHISLKISFPVDTAVAPAVIAAVTAYFKTLTPFTLIPRGIENEETIAWVRYRESPLLCRIHDCLNAMLSVQFGIGMHPYDGDYKFHTTLFMEEDVGKITAAYNMVKDCPLPPTVQVKRLLIGTSDSGELGSYSVHSTIQLS